MTAVSKFGNLRLLDFTRLKIEWKVGQGATATVWKGVLDARKVNRLDYFKYLYLFTLGCWNQTI